MIWRVFFFQNISPKNSVCVVFTDIEDPLFSRLLDDKLNFEAALFKVLPKDVDEMDFFKDNFSLFPCTDDEDTDFSIEKSALNNNPLGSEDAARWRLNGFLETDGAFPPNHRDFLGEPVVDESSADEAIIFFFVKSLQFKSTFLSWPAHKQHCCNRVHFRLWGADRAVFPSSSCLLREHRHVWQCWRVESRRPRSPTWLSTVVPWWPSSSTSKFSSSNSLLDPTKIQTTTNNNNNNIRKRRSKKCRAKVHAWMNLP